MDVGAQYNTKEWKEKLEKKGGGGGGSVLVERCARGERRVELEKNECSVSIRGCGGVKAGATQDGTPPGAGSYLGSNLAMCGLFDKLFYGNVYITCHRDAHRFDDAMLAFLNPFTNKPFKEILSDNYPWLFSNTFQVCLQLSSTWVFSDKILTEMWNAYMYDQLFEII